MLTQRELEKNLTHVSDKCGGCSGPGVVPMSPRKIKALFRQFPWVKGHLPRAGIEQFHVVRVEQEILDYTPRSLPVGEDKNHDGLYCEQLRLLDADGGSIVRSAQVTTKNRRFVFFGPIREKVQMVIFTGLVQNSTVKETFEALGEMGNRVQFILSCSHSTKAAIVYTMPRGMSFGEWIRAECKEKAEVKKEVVAKKDEAVSVEATPSVEAVPVEGVVVKGRPSQLPVVSSRVLVGMPTLAQIVVRESCFVRKET